MQADQFKIRFMEERNFDIVKRLKTKNNTLFYISAVIFIIVLAIDIFFTAMFGSLRNAIVIVAIVQFFLVTFINLFRSFIAIDYRIVGIIKLKEEGFLINLENIHTEEFRYTDLSSLKITYNGYKGQMESYYKSFASSDGAYNEIRFDYNGQKHKYLFLIRNKFDERWIRDYLKFLMSKGTDFTFKDSYSIPSYFGLPIFIKKRTKKRE
jgi:hypothetical protein